MELRGIEPLSEDFSIIASPITVALLTFPQIPANRQAETLSSFMNLLLCQSFHSKVPHWFDALS